MPGAMPPAKKSNAILWILGGCGTLIVLVILGFVGVYFWAMHKAEKAGISREQMQKNPALAGAKIAVTMNPDTEIVSSDDNAGTIVVRDKRTGKITKMKFDPQKKTMVITDDKGKESTFSANTEKGTLEVKSDDGTMKLGANADKPPDWVPVYPGSSPKNTYSLSDAKEQNGSYVFTTTDSVEKVMSYYSDQLKAGGLKTSSTSSTTDGKVSGMVSGEDSDHKRTLLVTAHAESDGTNVSVVFTSKK